MEKKKPTAPPQLFALNWIRNRPFSRPAACSHPAQSLERIVVAEAMEYARDVLTMEHRGCKWSNLRANRQTIRP